MGNNALNSQKGVALITVMLIVALAAIIASQMTTRLQMQMQRSTNTSFNQQAYWYAVGAEEFAKSVLTLSFKTEKDITHLGQQWAAGATNFPVDFGSIGGEITDLQSCLNLNALRAIKTNAQAAPGDAPADNKLPARVAFEKLLLALSIEGVDNFEAEAMADSLTDWLDEDGFIVGSGAEDDDYASREFPFLAANHNLASISELRLIEHFTPKVILAIKPYVCVLPQNNEHMININTLNEDKVELLQALLGSSLDEAQEVLSAIPEKGYQNTNDFLSIPELSTIQLKAWHKKQFVVDSKYFALKAKADFNDSYFFLNSIIQVNDDQKIQIISRTIGRN